VNCQDRNLAESDDFFGDAAQGQPADSMTAVCPHHYELGPQLVADVQDAYRGKLVLSLLCAVGTVLRGSSSARASPLVAASSTGPAVLAAQRSEGLARVGAQALRLPTRCARTLRIVELLARFSTRATPILICQGHLDRFLHPTASSNDHERPELPR
jgi:hypothetical protein